MLSVPLPVIFRIVTVRVFPVPVTTIVPFAVPVRFRLMFAAIKLLEANFHQNM